MEFPTVFQAFLGPSLNKPLEWIMEEASLEEP